MTGESTNGHSQARADTPSSAQKRRTPWPLMVVAALFVVVPFAAWYTTWFGRGLSDEQIEKYFDEAENARHVQHALSQIAERIEQGSAGVERWYPRVIEAGRSRFADVRMTAAWVMGLEHRREDFRAALLPLVEDPEPIVRRNAALALVRYGDARCRPVLLSMLEPYAVASPSEGEALAVLSEGTIVKRETMLARVKAEGERIEEVRAPLPGRIMRASVKEGDRVTRGGELFVVSPDGEHVRDALIGLSFFGEAEDVAALERYAAGVEGMPEDVKKQAALSAEAVRRRTARGR